MLRNSNSIGTSFTQCHKLDSVPLNTKTCLLQVNSVADERTSENELIENNDMLKQIAELNESKCIKFPEENRQMLSTLTLKSSEAGAIYRSDALLKKIEKRTNN